MSNLISQNEIRKNIIEARKSISHSDLDKKSNLIYEKVIKLNSFKKAKKIAIYLSINSEVSTNLIIDYALGKGKQIYLPFVREKNSYLDFISYKKGDELGKDLLGLPAPKLESGKIDFSELDLIITPLVAFDSDNNRVGMGGGYYDRVLKFTNCLAIGLAFAEQRVKKIKPNRWDIKLNKIITDD